MPTPSLVNIPFITAPSVLFSQIPESGAGDFSVTRATTPDANRSTRVNSAGLIELVADNVPRIDYPIGGAVNGCPALLVEPAATNLLNSDLSAAFYSRQFISNINTIAGGFPSPSNITAYKIIPDATSNQHRIFTTINVADHNFSVYCKPDGYNFVSLAEAGGLTGSNIIFDIQNGTISGSLAGFTPFIQPYIDGWYQIGYSRATTLTNTTRWIIVRDANNTNNYQGDGVKGVLFAGPQIAAGLPLQSVIFGGANTARGADVVRKTGITSLIGQSEGTVYFEVEVRTEARDKWIFTLDSSATSYIQAWIDQFGRIRVLIDNAGSTVMTSLTSSALSVGYHKMAFAYNTATNGCEMFIDGVQNPVVSRTVTGAGIPALNNFTLGSFVSSPADTLKGHVRAGLLYPNRLSNLRLEFLTAPVTYTTYAQMANALSYILP